MRDDDTFRLPDDDELLARAAELRREWQSDEEEWSRAALEHFRHQRTMADVLRDAMHRGDVVILGAGADSVRGTVVHVGDDWCRIDAAGRRVEVPLAGRTPIVRLGERVRDGGCTGDPGAAIHWRARLLELEASGLECVAEFSGGDACRGRLSVGLDHVVVTDGDVEIYVPEVELLRIRPSLS